MRHARALRLRTGESVLLSNGAGILARAHIFTADRNDITVAVDEILGDTGELPFRLVLALGVLDNRDRFEFVVEKAVELGAVDFVPLATRYGRAGKLHTERLRNKAVAAMKQARRAVLMQVHEPMPLDRFLSDFCRDAAIFLADADGGAWSGAQSDVCVVVGPEGGLADDELSLVRSQPGCRSVKLANRRLRAETAAVLATGLAGMP